MNMKSDWVSFLCFFVFPAMHDASRRLQDCLADMYEPEWFGKEEMDALAEVSMSHVCAVTSTTLSFTSCS